MKTFSSFHSSILFITTEKSGVLPKCFFPSVDSVYLCIYMMHEQELAGIFSPDLHTNINRTFSKETSVCKSENIQIISFSKCYDSDVFMYV